MREQKVEFKVGGEALRGSLFIPEGNPPASQAKALRAGGPFPGVIFFHGNGGKGASTFEAASKLPEIGVMSLAFNFRGCGLSDGDYSTQTHGGAIQDAIAAFEFFLKQNIDLQRIGVVGGSFGGYIASMLLPEFNIKSLVFRAPSACTHSLEEKLDMGTLQHEVDYSKEKGNWVNSKSYDNIAKFNGSLLVVKSENDENVADQVVDRYFEQAVNTSRKEIKTISGSDHRMTEQKWRDEFHELMKSWFLETL